MSISASNEYLGLISFRIDWFDLLGVQETLKSLFQHHSSKASIHWHSAFFASLVAQLVKNRLACRRPGLHPWVGKIPCRREKLPTPVFWPGEVHGQRSLESCSPWGRKESNMAFTFFLSINKYRNICVRFVSLESPQDCKEIKPVNPKRNQP